MSTNYDLEPLKTPPWWPGVIGLLVIAIFWIVYIYCKY